MCCRLHTSTASFSLPKDTQKIMFFLITEKTFSSGYLWFCLDTLAHSHTSAAKVVFCFTALNPSPALPLLRYTVFITLVCTVPSRLLYHPSITVSCYIFPSIAFLHPPLLPDVSTNCINRKPITLTYEDCKWLQHFFPVLWELTKKYMAKEKGGTLRIKRNKEKIQVEVKKSN